MSNICANSNSAALGGPWVWGTSSFVWEGLHSNSNFQLSASGPPAPALNTWYVLTLASNGATGYWYANYNLLATASTASGSNYVGFWVDASDTQIYYWLRTRAYPPSGVMPSYSFGAVQQTTNPKSSTVPSGIYNYTAITITNTQSTATPAPFQQMINITESSFSSYITYNNNFANFEYFYANGTIIPAWIEGNQSGKLITWVKLANGIPASSSITIYLGFAGKTTNLLSSSGTSGIGEAPQLSSTYAQYDDGASVFNNYWNFAGTSLPSGFTVANFLGQTNTGTATVNNGVTLSAGSSNGEILYYSSSTFSAPIVFETYAESTAATTGSSGYSSVGSGIDSGTSFSSTNFWLSRGANNLNWDYFIGGSGTLTSNALSLNTFYVWGIASSGTSSEVYVYGSGATALNPTYSVSSTASFPSSFYLLLANIDANAKQVTYWLRTRAYPPSGVMPSVTFGDLSLTVSVSPSTSSIDVNQNITLVSTVSGGTAPYTYQWYNITSGSAVAISGANQSNYTVYGVSTGTFTYFVSVTDSHPTTVNSTNVTVTVNPVLLANPITPSSPTIDSGQTITLTANASGGTMPYSYQWYSGTSSNCSSDTAISGATSSTYNASPTSNT
ncbi:MAG: hypothetical protein ACP5MB_11045, partial [bacterium]